MTQAGKPILEAQAWIVGDVDGLEHDAAPSRRSRRQTTSPTWTSS